MKPFAFETAEMHENSSNVPSSVTLLVSLFLILLVFFIVINSSAERNLEKKEAAMRSMSSKFGNPADDKINFGGVVKPKIKDYALEIEKLLGEAARIESSLDGRRSIIILNKDSFYFSDEPSIRPDQADNIHSMMNILAEWNKAQPLRVTILVGMDNYILDTKRLANLEKDFSHRGIFETNTGMNTGNNNMLNFTVDYVR